ncbi:MAG: FecR domain-containing protein [Burkholderiales bacterium]|nr:FecR domain-containing protein [Burkholderiales bacterium]
MNPHRLFRFMLATSLAAFLPLAFAQNTTPVKDTQAAIRQAARIALVEGDVALYDAKRTRRAAKVGETVNEGDNIVTGADGELHLDMEDGGYLSVRPNTKMRITKYQADGEDTDSAIFGVLQGGFRSVTGWIGKLGKDRYQVKTPTATVGIRGTDHETLVIPQGSSEGEPGLYDRVYEGGTYITTEAGRVEVSPNRAGFAGLDRKVRPRLLQDVPKFFRPGRFESRFVGKHAAVQAIIEKRRAERRENVKRRLEALKEKAQDGGRRPLAERAEARKEAIKTKAEDNKDDSKRVVDTSDRKTLREEAKERRVERREDRKDRRTDDDKPGK